MASQTTLNQIMEQAGCFVTAKDLKDEFKKKKRPAMLSLIEKFKSSDYADFPCAHNELVEPLDKIMKLSVKFSSYVYNKDKAGALKYDEKINNYVKKVWEEADATTWPMGAKDIWGDVIDSQAECHRRMMRQLDTVLQADIVRKREKEQAAKKAKKGKGKKGRK